MTVSLLKGYINFLFFFLSINPGSMINDYFHILNN